MAGIETSGNIEILQSPLCRELRTKKFYFLDTIPMTTEDVMDASNHCWCRRTMQVIGPDGNIVHPDDCGKQRNCYKSHFE